MKKSYILFLVIGMIFVSLLGRAADPSINYLKDLKGGRFTRTVEGVITDSKTQLQWKEGPDKATNWNEAQAWIKTLGNGWRTPTLAELAGICIEDSQRLGSDNGLPNLSLPSRSLKLDSTFHIDKAYAVWSEPKNDSSAWYFSFTYGANQYNTRDHSSWRYRAFAVRSR